MSGNANLRGLIRWGYALLLLTGCGYYDQKTPEYALDFSTPEGAILCLEDAYRRRDLNGVLKCKAFHEEARLMFEERGDLPANPSKTQLDQLAHQLTRDYSTKIREEGFPDLNGVKTTFPEMKAYKEKELALVTIRHEFPDGTKKRERVLVVLTNDGWRVINMLP